MRENLGRPKVKPKVNLNLSTSNALHFGHAFFKVFIPRTASWTLLSTARNEAKIRSPNLLDDDANVAPVEWLQNRFYGLLYMSTFLKQFWSSLYRVVVLLRSFIPLYFSPLRNTSNLNIPNRHPTKWYLIDRVKNCRTQNPFNRYTYVSRQVTWPCRQMEVGEDVRCNEAESGDWVVRRKSETVAGSSEIKRCEERFLQYFLARRMTLSSAFSVRCTTPTCCRIRCQMVIPYRYGGMQY